MVKKLLLIVGCVALVSCEKADAAKPEAPPHTNVYMTSAVMVYVDSSRHIACYSYAGIRTGTCISCIALDSTNSHAK